jgi:integrase
MASIYYRGKPPAGTWWVQFYHPITGELSRFTLATGDKFAAEQLRRRIELEAELRRPELQLVQIPPPVLESLGAPPRMPRTAAPAAPALAAGGRRAGVRDLLALYWVFIREENVAAHRRNKLSILRHFFGWQIVHEVTGMECRSKPEAYFTGEFADEITAACVRDFIGSRGLEPKTKRHYRELFHNLFEVALADGLIQATNIHSPNPMAALPSYGVRRRKPIVFLDAAQVQTQLDLLAGSPSMQAAVALMLHAGLRRSEALWLKRDCIGGDFEFLTVRTQCDPESGDEDGPVVGGVKTDGSTRPVSILPPLRSFLERYLPALAGDWLVPDPRRGSRWDKDNFSCDLRKFNRKHGLTWTCLHYRHTFATNRCAEGWNVWDLAKEMGTSVAMIEQHYAAFVRPARQQRQPPAA